MIAFSDIECEPPGKLSREEFLGEVQYLANWPDEINLLDDVARCASAVLRRSGGWKRWESANIMPPRQARRLTLSDGGVGRGATGRQG